MAMKYFHRVLICGMTQCVSSDSEVLTPEGWKDLDYIIENKGVRIAVFNISDEDITFEIPSKWNFDDIDDYMIRIHSDDTDQLVTKNHRVLSYDGVSYDVCMANEISSGITVPVIDDSYPDGIYPSPCNVENIKYKGIVFCPTVSTGNFLCRRKGKVFITGNSGKTTFLKKAIMPYLLRWVAYDPDSHFVDIPGVTVVESFEEFEDNFPSKPNIVFVPTDDMMKSFDKRVAEFNAVCLKICDEGAHMTFIIDEIANVTMKNNRASIPEELQVMIKRREMPLDKNRKTGGRIGVFVTTQRPKDAAVDLITQCKHVIAFRLTLKDIKYVEESYDVELRDIISSLKPFQAVHYEDGSTELTFERLSRKQVHSLGKKPSRDDEDIEDIFGLIDRRFKGLNGLKKRS